MRVGFDVTALLAGDTGVARYTRELGAALEARNGELVRFAIGRGNHRDALPPRTRELRVPLRLVHRSWALAGMPSAERLAPGCDVVHTPDLVPPPTRRPLVLTVHDLVAVEHPELHPPRSTAVQRAQVAAARDRAAIVLSDSEATATMLRAHGVDARRITVVPIGVTPLPRPDISLVPGGSYFLAVGSLTPRKGLATLVEAFACASLPKDVRLVLAGPHGWQTHELLATIERCNVADRVRCPGRVTDAQLAGLYEGCLAVCVPSIAEGFGLPVLEAASMGAAVLASDLPVFRELDDMVTTFVPVRDVDAWAAALERAEHGGATSVHARDAAQQYTWDRTATLTLAAYHRALETSR
jgi:glycosyltransferase involved in cell wall biosynthesis